MMSDLDLQQAHLWGDSDATVIEEINRLRLAAWRPLVGDDAEQRFGIDDLDRRSWHVVTRWEGDIVAAGRVTPLRRSADLPRRDGYAAHAAEMRFPAAIAGRLVVHPCHQGRGLGARIIAERLALATAHGLREVWGETREEQIDGLGGFGYEVVARSTDASVPGSWWVMRARLSTI